MHSEPRILIIHSKLMMNGSVKSLFALLRLLVTLDLNVDLMPLWPGGELSSNVPDGVRVIRPQPEYSFYQSDLVKGIKCSFAEKRYFRVIFRIGMSIIARIAPTLWWYLLRANITPISGGYDVAIAYTHGGATHYLANLVKAKRKIAWFHHGSYERHGIDRYIDRVSYERSIDCIVAVSDGCRAMLERQFPSLQGKVTSFPNIIIPCEVIELANREPDINIQQRGLTIISVGRLMYEKGFDLAIQACRLLVDEVKPLEVHWYVLGDGLDEESLKNMITSLGVQGYFHLLGAQTNPYPYMKLADVYVQPSRVESEGMAIREAQILGKCVVATKTDCGPGAVQHGENGLLVDCTPQAICDGIKEFIYDSASAQRIREKLAKQVFSAPDYALIKEILYLSSQPHEQSPVEEYSGVVGLDA